jgi:hypothetical protein
VGICLDSNTGHLSLSNADWYKTVQLAYQHGFTPPKQHPTLLTLEPFTLSASATSAFHAALLRALPNIADEPNSLYEVFERELLGSNIPTAEAWLHLAGKRPLLERLLLVMKGEVKVTWVPDAEETSSVEHQVGESNPAQPPPLKKA